MPTARGASSVYFKCVGVPRSLEVGAPADYDSVFAPLAAKPIGGLVMFTDPLTWANWKRVADFAFANRLPTVCEFRQLAESGCLVSYGPTFDEFSVHELRLVGRVIENDGNF